MTNTEEKELEYAKEYFLELGVVAYVDDGSLYIEIDCLDDQHVQLSSSEVSYRADIYQSRKER